MTPPLGRPIPAGGWAARAAGLVAVVLGTLLVGCSQPSSTVPAPTDDRGDRGAVQFQTYCAACHGADGSGMDGRIPPLAGSQWVSGPEDRIIRVVLHGLRGPVEVGGARYEMEMLGFGQILGDEDVASILTHVRGRFGRSTGPVTSQRVARVRAETVGRTDYWTAEELLAIPSGGLLSRPATV